MGLARERPWCSRAYSPPIEHVDSGYNKRPDYFEISEVEYGMMLNRYIIGGIEHKQVVESGILHRYCIFYFYDYVLGVAVDQFFCGEHAVRFLKIGTPEEWSDFTRKFADQFKGDNS